MLVEPARHMDVAAILRDLNVEIAGGTTSEEWRLRTPDGRWRQVMPQQYVKRLNAHSVRTSQKTGSRPLHIGTTATEGVTTRASQGEIDVLTSEPPRLIIGGNTYGKADSPQDVPHTARRRPAWIRWGVMRYLLITRHPSRHREIAAALGTSQQSVSNAARSLGQYARDLGDGLTAWDRPGLLTQWTSDYPGPGGQLFGWYSLAPVREQATKALDLARLLDEDALLSGDVAADHLAPWKIPTQGIVYTRSPVDLTGEGFVPAPLDQATLVVCTPQDPTVWKLAAPPDQSILGSHVLADPALVFWDVHRGADPDSLEAAAQIAELLLGVDRG
ncbi:hypothetical protein [Kocuria sp. ZOR0020]|uniref:hypothetical protein n=1 Tax=Kocuria sp. ZOR0020 TaxID=1339234 RepID=UPI0012E0ACD2|nr:hypothetical protein [Kocuria sp. ZOR0020]